MSMMKRNRGAKKPLAFYLIIVLAAVLSVVCVVWLPIPEPYAMPLKTLIFMLLLIALAFLGIYLYTKQFRRGGR